MKCYTVGVHLKYSIYLQQSLFRGGGETPNYVKSDLNHPMDVCVQIIPIPWRWPVAPKKCTLNLATLQSSRMAQRVFTKARTFFCEIEILYAIMSQHDLFIYTIGNRRVCTSVL